MLSTLSMPVSNKQAQLNQELRDYTKSIESTSKTIAVEELRAALNKGFPEYRTDLETAEEILENMGIVHILNAGEGLASKAGKGPGSKLITCSITDDRNEAEEQLRKLNEPRFSKLREDLNIMAHWIFLVKSGYLFLCSSSDLTDWVGDFRCDGYPECWILDELI